MWPNSKMMVYARRRSCSLYGPMNVRGRGSQSIVTNEEGYAPCTPPVSWQRASISAKCRSRVDVIPRAVSPSSVARILIASGSATFARRHVRSAIPSEHAGSLLSTSARMASGSHSSGEFRASCRTCWFMAARIAGGAADGSAAHAASVAARALRPSCRSKSRARPRELSPRLPAICACLPLPLPSLSPESCQSHTASTTR